MKKRKKPDFGAVNLTPALPKSFTLQHFIGVEYSADVTDPGNVEIKFTMPVQRIVLPRKLLKEIAGA